MITLILLIIYLAFIGLGLPDSLLGNAWPIMRIDLGASSELAGIIYFTVSVFTVASSLIANKMLYKFGTGKVTLVSISLTTTAMFIYTIAPNILVIFIGGIFLGLGAGAVDSALSNYVAVNFKAKHMSWLHCFWGIGAMVSPLVMSANLKNNGNWRGGFFTTAISLTVLCVILISALPLWKRLNDSLPSAEEEQVYISNRDAFKIKGVKSSILAMLTYTGAEAGTGLWIATYMVSKGETAEKAAAFASLFYLGIIIGRFLSGILTIKISCRTIIRFSAIIGCFGFLIMIISPSYIVTSVGLFIAGTGAAPIYPNIVHQTPEIFGKNNSQSIITLEMAGAYIGASVIPFVIGFICVRIGMWLMPYFLLFTFVIMLISTELIYKGRK